MYEKIYDFSSLMRAFQATRRGKLHSRAAAKFEIDLIPSLIVLSDDLRNKTFTTGKIERFKVFQPKERQICSDSFRDKVVQHALCDEVLYETFTQKFIYDNYASQTGKGLSFGLRRLEQHLRHYYFSRKYNPEIKDGFADGWVLKCDIRKFFMNIRHDIVKEKIRQCIDDADVIWLIDKIIDTVADPSLPIGYQSSQLLALLLLNDFDHMVKEQLHIKAYGRYVDDFYLIHHDKEYLKYCRNSIAEYLAQYDLELNEKTQIFPLKNGIDFLGFHTYLTDSGKVIRKLRKSSKDNMRRKLKKFKQLHDNGEMQIEDIQRSYQSWRAHAKNGNTYYLIKHMDKLYNDLFLQGGKNLAVNKKKNKTKTKKE